MSARSGHLPVAALLGCLLAAPASGQVEQLTWEDPTLPRAVKDADLIVLGRATDVSARGAVYAVERTLVGPDRTGSSIAVTGLHHPQLAERPHVAVGDRAYLLLIGDPRGEGFTIPTPTFGRFPLQRDGERERVIASMGGADTFARLAVAPGRFEALVHAARTGSDPRLLRAAQQTVDAEAPPAEALYWALQGLRLTLGAAPDEVRDGAIPGCAPS